MTMIALPMTPQLFVGDVLEPALDLLPARMGSIEARIMLIAIALQESGLAHRWQVVDLARPWIKGPARGLLQFEQGGGVKGVLTHKSSREYAVDVCMERRVVAAPIQVYEALHQDDILAVALGRLLLWTDPRRLPDVGDALSAWALYARVWRPGKPHIDKWPANYRAACAALGA